MYQKTVLPNGITIVSEYAPHLRSVTLGAWFAVGSRHEKPEEWGLSHFIEHMMFKGTRKYSARQIAEIMDHNGGYLNAFTGKEHTCYYFKVLDEYFSQAAEVLREMLINSQFATREIIKERNVVLEELSMYEDSPEDLIHDLFAKQLWPEHPLGNSILGSPDTISSFDQGMIAQYLENNYTADQLIIVSVGNIAHGQVVDELAGAFANLPRKSVPTIDAAPNNQVNRSWFFQDKETEQIHLCLGGPALSRAHPHRYTLILLDTILGGGISSLLFQELREERGLVYNTYSFNSAYGDAGYYGIYAGFSPKNWNQVWNVLCEQLTSLPKNITEERFVRAKGQLRGGTMLSLESTSNRMTRLAMGILDEGRIITAEEICSKIDAVDYDDLLKIAREIYDPASWTWVALGPRSEIKEDILCRKIC